MKPLLSDNLLRGEVEEKQDLVEIRERSLFDLLSTVWRRRKLALTILVIALGVAVILIKTLPEKYTAEAILQLNTQSTEFADFDNVVTQRDADEYAVASEVHAFASYPVAIRVVDRLDLMNDPEFNDLLHDDPLNDVHGTIGSYIGSFWTTADAADPITNTSDLAQSGTGTPNALDETAKINVAANLLKNLSVWDEERSFTIFASFISEDRLKAATILNTFAQVYLQRQLETTAETTGRVNDWLNERLEEVREEVRIAEAKIEAYRQENQLLNQTANGAGSLAGQQLNQINQEMVEINVRRTSLEAQLARARQQLENGSPFSIPEVIVSPVIQQMRADTIALDRQRTEFASIYGDNHPTMKAIITEAQRLQAKVNAEVSNIVDGIASELNVVVDRQIKLKEAVVKLRSAVGDVDRTTTKLRELERDAEASQALFQSLANRREQAQALEDAQQAVARLVAPAVPPKKPSQPKHVAVIGASLAAGIVVIFLLVAVLEFTDKKRVRSATDLEDLIGLPCFGSVPEVNDTPARGLFGWRKSSENDSYLIHANAVRKIKNSTIRGNIGGSTAFILVTSSLPAEGKSTLAADFAKCLADGERNTLLVDADIHRPTQKNRFDLDALKPKDGHENLYEISDKNAHFDVLFLEKITDEKDGLAKGDISGTTVLQDHILDAGKGYDVVVIDTPPVVLMDDATMLSGIAHSILYLVRWNETPVEAVKTGLNRLCNISGQPEKIGMILSRVDLQQHLRSGVRDESYFATQYSHYYS